MSRTSPHQRVFALVGALLILGTAVASGVVVIWQINQDNKNTANTASQTDTSSQTQTNNGGTKLEGTKLTDFTPVAKVDSLQISDPIVGTGDTVVTGDTITAHYTGALASSGVIFQSSLDSGQPFTSPLSGLIAGWQKGIPGMKVGGTRRLLIPSAEAYGSQAQSGIPANSDLVFDIQLVSVKHQ